jgi:hypothetical protein
LLRVYRAVDAEACAIAHPRMSKDGLASTTAKSNATIAVTAIANLPRRHLRVGPLAMQMLPHSRSSDAPFSLLKHK